MTLETINSTNDQAAPAKLGPDADRVAVDVRSMTCDFGADRGVFNVTFSVNWGSVLSIMGGNGSGKTTCLRCVGLFQPIAPGGFIRLAGESWIDEPCGDTGHQFRSDVDCLRGQILGIVFQQAEPWPHLNVLENVLLPLRRVASLSKQEAKARAEESLELFGVLDRAKAMHHQLSGGLRQRVALARAFALQPRILLLDEITSALDPEWTERVRAIVRRFADNGGAVLNISHRIGFIRHLSNRIIYLDGGRVVEEGDPTGVLDSPKSEKLRRFIENA